MSQTRGMFQAIKPLKTLYKVRYTNPNYSSVVVEPLNFLRNFRFFSNNPAAEDLAKNNNNNNNNHRVEFSQSGHYKESSVGFGQDWLIRGNNRDFKSNPIRKVGLFSENLRQNYSTRANVYNTSSGYQESNDADKSSQLLGSLEELEAFCKEGKLKEAVQVMGLLEQQQISIDLEIYLLMINACGKNEALEEGKYVHEHLMRSVHILDVRTNNKILDMYGKCDSMEDALKVFNGMLERDLTSCGILITSLAKNGFGEDALELFTEFKKIGLKPDSEMFFGVFIACSVVGDINEGLLHFESMSKDYGIVPSMKQYVSVVEMLASTGYLDETLEFIEKMPMEPSVDVWEALMNLSRIHGQTVLGDRCAEIVEQLDHSRLDEFSKEGLIRVTDVDIAREEERENKKLALEDPYTESANLYYLLWGLRQQMKEVGYMPDVTFVRHDLDIEGKVDCLLAHSERLDLARGLMCSPARSHLHVWKSIEVCHDCLSALKIISKLVGREIFMRDALCYFRFKDGVCLV